eukprot:15014983-Alexandrium_andersonii.AAC.1
MSASLVGSEMCIRDRRYTKRYKPLAAICSGLLRGLPRGATAPRGTVSYTHLTLPTICSV